MPPGQNTNTNPDESLNRTIKRINDTKRRMQVFLGAVTSGCTWLVTSLYS